MKRGKIVTHYSWSRERQRRESPSCSTKGLAAAYLGAFACCRSHGRRRPAAPSGPAPSSQCSRWYETCREDASPNEASHARCVAQATSRSGDEPEGGRMEGETGEKPRSGWNSRTGLALPW